MNTHTIYIKGNGNGHGHIKIPSGGEDVAKAFKEYLTDQNNYIFVYSHDQTKSQLIVDLREVIAVMSS